MQFDFFPSRTLTLYLAKLFIVRIVAMLAILVLVLMMLDLLSTSGEILAVAGNGQGELLKYASLRIPQLIARFLPYSVLLATIITLITLNQNSEVVAMKAAGLSAHQVLAPLFLTAAVVSAASFVFNERVVTRATATLKAWEGAEYGPVPREPDTRANVYLTDGDNILTAVSLSGSGANIRMQGVTWYRRAPGGMLAEQVRAERASYANPGWTLEGIERFDVASANSSTMETMTVGEGLTPEQIELDSVDADTQGFFELYDSIDAYERVGRRTSELRAKWWHKLSGPLSAGGLADRAGARARQPHRRARDGQFRRLPALPRRLGAVLPVRADRRDGAHPDRGVSEDWSLRLARPEDAGALPVIERAASVAFAGDPDLAGVDFDDVWTAAEHRAFIRRGHCLVAESHGEIVGFLAAQPFGRELHVWEMDVLPEHQGRRIGATLMRACIIDAANAGFSALTLTTFRDLPWNGPFYARLGFVEIEDLAAWPRLAAELAEEDEAGLPRERRCAMVRFLD